MPSFAHIRAHARCRAGHPGQYQRRSQELLCYPFLFADSILALSLHSRRGARRQAANGRNGLRSQPLRASESRKPAAHLRVVRPCSAPRVVLGSLDRRVMMSTLDTLPGEWNSQIISSIINSVCPQCGGRMSEFQCEGRCFRNWLAEWEWANQAIRSPKSQPRRAGRSMR